MFTLPENNFYRALLWLATVIVTILYSWLASVAMAPSPTMPSGMIAQVHWVKGGSSYRPDLAPGFKWLEFQRMGDELRSVSNSMPILGGLSRPIHLMINADEPRVLRVNDNQIEIGLELAQAHGQLSKAVLKSWILQNADVSISGSLLRADAVSDALTLMIGSVSEIQDANGKALNLRKSGPRNWLAYMVSMREVCESSFNFAELQNLCKSKLDKIDELTPLSFRPLLAEWMLFHYESTPMGKRIEFLERWASHLRKPLRFEADKEDFYRLTNLQQWRDRLRKEVAELLPAEIAALSASSRQAESMARLAFTDSPFFDRVIIREEGKSRTISPLAYAKFEAADSGATIELRQVVWEGCNVPTVEDLLGLKLKAERALIVENCSGQKLDLKSLDRSVPDFAKVNPNVAFAQLRIEGIRLALHKGFIKDKTKIIDLINIPERATESKAIESANRAVDIFGLQHAKWKSEITAYTAVGAIEAIEWFRPRSKAIVQD